MTPAQVEHWVLQLADDVRAQKPVEDSRVELKATWPVPEHRTSRRLAGLANAARLEEVLWVVGLDEKAGTVLGVRAEELANWLPQIQKYFQDVAPLLIHNVNVAVEGVTVVGLLFDTSRAPFVVTVPNTSPFDREVPWREGNATRSATREDLIRILVPRSRAPRLEMLQGTLSLFEQPNQPHAIWRLDLRFYLTPSTRETVYFPFHKCAAIVRVPGGTEILLDQDVELSEIVADNWPTNITRSVSEMMVSGPGLANLTAAGHTEKNLLGHGMNLEFLATIETTDDHRVALTGRLLPSSGAKGATAVWKLDGHRPLLYMEP